MVKPETEERVIDLTRYLPGFLREVEELSQTARAEETETGRLYGKMDQTWNTGFIRTADLQGIKRWEALLGIKPYSGDTLEERRSAVLSRWNQQLPYSLARLKERLDASVGHPNYELDVRYHLYELELVLIDQAYRTMRETHDMTKAMIPANLLLIFAGKFPVEIPVDIHYTGRLELQSEYHARYNRKFLILDGTWGLDGTYKLNGYKELTDIDLYPLALTVRGGYNTAPDTSADVSCRSGTEVAAGTESAVEISGSVFSPTATESRSRTGSKVTAGPGADLVLTVEKDLWYLDGNYLLDGTKLLDAEIIRYE